MTAMRLRLAVVAVGITTLASCGRDVSSPDASAPPSADATSAVAAQPCGDVTLISPSGEPVNLTGAWRGGSGIWIVFQLGDCVAIEGLSEFPGEEHGSRWRSVFSGNVRTDLSVVGRWTWTFISIPPSMIRAPVTEETLFILFEDDEPILGTSPFSSFLDADPRTEPITWTRISTDTQVPPSE